MSGVLPTLLFDLESNGLLHELTAIHILAIKAKGVDKRAQVYSDVAAANAIGTIAEGAKRLLDHTVLGGVICGHNVISFDIPAIQKLHPWFKPRQSSVLDTVILSRLMFADMWDQDKKLAEAGKLPKHLMNSHKLEAWGRRLGNHKGDYSGGWAEWNQEMQDYCIQDVEVTDALHTLMMKRCGGDTEEERKTRFSLDSVRLEHDVAFIITRQIRRGFAFDEEKAVALYATLAAEKAALELKLMQVFGARYFRDGGQKAAHKVPKRDNKKMGYTAGAPFTKVKLTDFNPTSRQHIAAWLKALYGWEPTEFTEDGSPKVDETTLAGLNYPPCVTLRRYLVVDKRLGQLATGKQAWLRKVENGRIHGGVITNGAVTGRMTHSNPNLGQVPSGKSLYGHECRELFTVTPGYKLVGCDADALELRDLAGYMAAYDGGEYIRTVLEGNKDLGTDMHSVNARALGLEPKKVYYDGTTGRDIAKTWFYAFIYGAGDEKLGFILTNKRNQKAIGKKSKDRFMRGLPALGKLVEMVKKVIKARGFLRGLDGRLLKIRAAHAALNTLLQSAGAVQMKRALVILDGDLQAAGLIPGDDYEFVANVHDEWQIEVKPEHAETVGKAAAEAIRKAGESFGFRCPLAGQYQIGNNWAETH